jgi:hypothetical protein
MDDVVAPSALPPLPIFLKLLCQLRDLIVDHLPVCNESTFEVLPDAVLLDFVMLNLPSVNRSPRNRTSPCWSKPRNNLTPCVYVQEQVSGGWLLERNVSALSTVLVSKVPEVIPEPPARSITTFTMAKCEATTRARAVGFANPVGNTFRVKVLDATDDISEDVQP